MAYYVYILESLKNGQFYKGFSEQPLTRLQQHNNGETSSIKPFTPWKLVYIEQVDSKKAALIRERNLKKASRERIQALIANPKNIAGRFR